MPKTKHYPPSYLRYQIEHPPVTVHLSKKIKENLDAIKGDRSYAEVINEIINDAFNLEQEIQKLPVNEAVISYHRGFREAEARYAQWDVCKKCGREWTLWKDGKCDLCHTEGSKPNYSYFRDSESAKVVKEEDFDRAKVKLPRLERLSYENGRKRGYDEGWSEGFDEAIEDYRITYPCNVCGKPIEMEPNSKSHGAMISYMHQNGWGHTNCH